ncbi:glyoxylate/hydroxypyruvate reductase A [Psychromonas sp. B3M02]|uniref:NAD(P)-dependent oxidoreductase n=1 Tax=Psychromonas sp. B3M02 TaxID=2267226 RepID=UPI000DE8F0FF|nr:NAD(P)-dependent oxidoreductase [Psychromonas sp. B3M02]RBW46907.1 glyoxylate/hydroxypyruvate reductase A [Psychromonas sp. B3M02]
MKPIVLSMIDNEALTEELLLCAKEHHPEVEWVLPDNPLARQAKIAACWYPPSTILKDYPELTCLYSVGAGVDNLGDLLDSGVEISRIVDDGQKLGMFEYVLWGVLYYQRDMDKYHQDNQLKQWNPLPQRSMQNIKVGILGLGELGGYVGEKLAAMGYQVSGWSRTKKHIEGVISYSGQDALPELLEDLDILVNLLPLNPETKGMLNLALLSKLPSKAALIHCGRGDHLVEGDLEELLNSNRLRGAILDVFSTEPLPKESNLMAMDKVFVTPHIASSASNESIVSQVSQFSLTL